MASTISSRAGTWRNWIEQRDIFLLADEREREDKA
jgi:hypothetical protein